MNTDTGNYFDHANRMCGIHGRAIISSDGKCDLCYKENGIPLTMTEYVFCCTRAMDEQAVPREGRWIKLTEPQFRQLFMEFIPYMHPGIPPSCLDLILEGYLYRAERNNNGDTSMAVYGISVQIADESDIAVWWNSTKDNGYWSGSIKGFTWDELWEDARDFLRKIYRKGV